MIHKSTVRLGFSPRIPLFHNNFHSSSTTVCWSHTPIRLGGGLWRPTLLSQPRRRRGGGGVPGPHWDRYRATSPGGVSQPWPRWATTSFRHRGEHYGPERAPFLVGLAVGEGDGLVIFSSTW